MIKPTSLGCEMYHGGLGMTGQKLGRAKWSFCKQHVHYPQVAKCTLGTAWKSATATH